MIALPCTFYSLSQRNRVFAVPTVPSFQSHPNRDTAEAMTDAPLSDRDETTGQFLKGYKGGPGRKIGSRNKLSGALVDALLRDFLADGEEAIRRMRIEDPSGYVRVIAGLLPNKIEHDVSLDLSGAQSALEAFRLMSTMLGADADVAVRNLRRVAPNLAIEYEPDDE